MKMKMERRKRSHNKKEGRFFVKWCKERGEKPWPTTKSVLYDYICDGINERRLRRERTVKIVVAIIKEMNAKKGEKRTPTLAPDVKDATDFRPVKELGETMRKRLQNEEARFRGWCKERKFCPFPTTKKVLRLYLGWGRESGKWSAVMSRRGVKCRLREVKC